MPSPSSIVEVGTINRNGLRLTQKTTERAPNHRYATLWVVECECGALQNVNSCEFHQALSRCTKCHRGKKNLPNPITTRAYNEKINPKIAWSTPDPDKNSGWFIK